MAPTDLKCLKPIPDNTILSDITQDNIAYYRNNIKHFIDKCQIAPEIKFKNQETQTFNKIRLVNKELEFIPRYYIFKTDITNYFATSNKTFSDYMSTLHNDLYRTHNSFILFEDNSSEPILLELTNKDRFYIEGEKVDYLTLLKYSICLFNTLFMSKLSSKIESYSDELLSGDCCNNNQLSKIKIVDDTKFKKYVNDDSFLLKSFSKINITSKIENRTNVNPITIPYSSSRPRSKRLSSINVHISPKLLNPNATIIKCVLSNLVFIHQLYKILIKRIISSYYKTFFDSNNEDMADLFIKGDDYDYCINRQDKSITIIFNINYKDFDNIKFTLGKLSFIIYFNTLEQITKEELNDAYIIIETYDHVNTKDKFELILNNLKTIKKDIVAYKPSISNKLSSLLTRSQNKQKHTKYNNSQRLEDYYNTIPRHNIPNVEKLSQAQLYTRISGKLTDYITTIFNFMIHTSPYKNAITKHLFNLEEKINYETNTINTNQITDFDFDQFEFENTNNKPNNVPKYKDNEHYYKMYFCANDPNNKEFYEFNTSNRYLGEKLYHFFKAENDKNIFIGFIMNLPNNSIPSKAYGLISSVKGHLNTFIIDKKNKLIIRFEPKGKESIVYCNVTKNMIIDYINKSISQFWGRTHPRNSKYISDELKNLLIYKYIDTSNRDINIVRDNNTNTRANSSTTSTSRKNSLKVRPVHFPQGVWRDDNCQTYSLYGAFLYAMNYEHIDVTKTQESIHNTIFKLFSQITKEKSIKLQYFLKDKLDKLMPVFTESREQKHDARLNNMEAPDNFDDETGSIKNYNIDAMKGVRDREREGERETEGDMKNNNSEVIRPISRKQNERVITKNETTPLLQNNKTKKNTTIRNNNNNIYNTRDRGEINKIDIVKLDTPEHKKTIETIFYDFETRICKNQIVKIEEKDYICKTISLHSKKLEETYKAYLNSQKFFSRTKKNKKSLEQEYYRVLLECDLIYQILKLKKKSKTEELTIIEKINMIRYLLDSISKNHIYSISKFNTIKDDIFSLVKSIKNNTRNNVNNVLRKHGLTQPK
jgi:hypothetical protein